MSIIRHFLVYARGECKDGVRGEVRTHLYATQAVVEDIIFFSFLLLQLFLFRVNKVGVPLACSVL